MDIYSQHPLSQSDTIRILVVAPAEFSTTPKIFCSLETVRLSDATSGGVDSLYNTLSYTWGSQRTLYTIFVDGQSFEVGHNLYSALRHLRLSDRSLRIWIDAICINQGDKKEREQQVQLMRDIYANSEKTIIFLGEENGAACVNAWNFLEYRDPEGCKTDQGSFKDHYREVTRTVNFATGYTDVLDAVITRDWFQRIWVLQELVVSSFVEIRCGTRRTSWDNFERTLFMYLHEELKDENEMWGEREAIAYRLREICGGKSAREARPSWDLINKSHPNWQSSIQGIREMCLTRFLYQKAHGQPRLQIPQWLLKDPLAHFIDDDMEHRQGSLRMMSLLTRGRRYLSTDPRDKVIALIGLRKDFSQNELECIVNYSRATEDVYRNVVIMIVRIESSFDILCQAGGLSVNDQLFSSWAGKWDSSDFPSVSVLSRLGSESETYAADRCAFVDKHHAWSEDERLLYCTGGTMGTLVSMSGLSMPTITQIIAVSKHKLAGSGSVDRIEQFNRCAQVLLDSYHWSPSTEPLDPQLWNVEVNAQLSPFSDTWWDVTVRYTYKGSGSPPLDISLFPQQIKVSGGRGFIDDVAALQQGRKLGLVKSQSPTYNHNRPDYSFAVVPDCACIGDVVASFSGAKTLFLVYPENLSTHGHEDEDAKMFEKLPKSEKVDGKAMHCRIRGECRVNAFEDSWGLVDKVPLMTYAGYIPPEWQDTIFAIH